MPIALDNKDEALESALTDLGSLQPDRPLNKTAMLRAVAWAAVRLCQQSKNPLAWMSAASQPTTTKQESNGSPESVLTADPPTEKPVSNMQTEDEAGKGPTASDIEPQSDCNQSEARAKSA